MSRQSGGIGAALPLFLAAYERRPTRAESLWDMGRRCNVDGRHHTAYMALSAAIAIPPPLDTLFVHTNVYSYLIAFELSIAAWWTNRRDQAKQLNAALLMRDLPDHIAEAVRRNAAFA